MFISALKQLTEATHLKRHLDTAHAEKVEMCMVVDGEINECFDASRMNDYLPIHNDGRGEKQ